jgi:hypothetical protein
MQVAIVPREDITFTDGWFVQGLKGTGSYDYNARRMCSCRSTGPFRCSPATRTVARRPRRRLERAFRDLYTGTQHAFISEKVAIDAAQIWLGIIEDQPGL